MMPADVKAGTSVFKKSEVWASVGKQFDTPSGIPQIQFQSLLSATPKLLTNVNVATGKKVLAALGAKQAAYVKSLLGH